MLGRRAVSAALLAATLIGGALTFAGASTASAATLVVTTSVPDVQQGTPYSVTLSASGGTAPYTWTHLGGAIPPGLTFDPSGVISGTATNAANYGNRFTVTDSANPPNTAETSFFIHVRPLPFRFITTSLPRGVVGHAYSATLVAAGGTPPFKFSKLSPLPKGLKLARKTGVISGTPQKAGTYAVALGAKSSKQKMYPGGNPVLPQSFAKKTYVLVIR